MKKNSPQSITNENIEKAAFSLWKEKGINNTSVSDICQKANISRSTFYRHYENEANIIVSYLLRFVSYNKRLNRANSTNKELIRGQLLLLKRNYDRLSIIIASGYRRLMAELFWPELLSQKKCDLSIVSTYDYKECYSFGGFIITFMAWVESGKDEDAEEISLFFCEIFGLDPSEKRSEEEIEALAEKAKLTISLSGDLIPKVSS